MNFDETTPMPAAPPISGETPSTAPPDLAKAIGDMASSIKTLVDSQKAENDRRRDEDTKRSLEGKKVAQRATALLVLTALAVGAIGTGTVGIFDTRADVAKTVEQAEALAHQMEAIHSEQSEIRAASEEAAERAAEVAESQPRVEPVPATSAAAGKPAKPASIRLVFPHPKTIDSPAPSASIVVPIPAASVAPEPKTAASTGAGP